MRNLIDFVLVFTISVLVHYVVYQNSTIERLDHFIMVSTERNRINDDQVRDLTNSMISKSHENDATMLRSQGIVEGILTAIKEPDATEQYHEVWHDGYYRGLDQNEFVSERFYDKGYLDAMEDVSDISDNTTKQNTIIKTPDFDTQIIPVIPEKVGISK